jgi:pentatricopeptide repeat protein
MAFRLAWSSSVRNVTNLCRTCEIRLNYQSATRIPHTFRRTLNGSIANYGRQTFSTISSDTPSVNVDVTENSASSTQSSSIPDQEPIMQLENKRLDEIYREYQEVSKEGNSLTEQDYINLMNYCKRNSSARAQKFLEGLVDDIQKIAPEKTSLVTRGYNMLLQTYIHDNRWDDAVTLVSTLIKGGHYYNEITINTMISGSLKTSTIKNLHQFIAYLEEHQHKLTDSNVDRLIKACHLGGDVESAIIYFNRAKAGQSEVGSNAYQSMIYVLKLDNRVDEALSVFGDMEKSGIPTTVGTYHILLDLLHFNQRLKEMEDIYKRFQKSGLTPNISIYLAMGWDLTRAMNELTKQGGQLQVRDYNTLIVRSIQDNNIEQAISYFQSMQKEGIQANHVSYSIIMDALLKNRTGSQALDMYEHMIKSGVQPDTHAFNALLAHHIQNDDRVECLKALDRMHDKGFTPDARTINFLMSIVLSDGKDAQKDCEFLMKLFAKLKEVHSPPTAKTYNHVLNGLARLALERPLTPSNKLKITKNQGSASLELLPENAIELMRELYKQMHRSPLKFAKPNSTTYDLLICSLIDATQYRAAMRLYEDSKRSNVSVENDVLVRIQQGLVESGMDMQVIQMFYDHRHKKLPIKDPRYYNSVLDTCRRLGLSDTYQEVLKESEKSAGTSSEDDD